jgi:hypothetical protein
MNDIISSYMFLSMHNDTSTPHVTSTGYHNNVARVKLDILSDFALLKIKFDGVVGSNQRIGVANRATVVGDNMGDTTISNSYAADFEELVGSLFGCDAMDSESTLNIVKEAEVFP